MTDRELFEKALDCLLAWEEESSGYGWSISDQECVEALRARLAQPEPEPVATVYDAYDATGIDWHCKDAPPTGTKLYTASPQREWQGLTDEEIMDACSAVWASHPIEVGQVVAAILKEKNA